MLSFDFNGKNSYRDFGIYMESLPILPTPKRRVSYFDMLGKNGSLKYDENTYEDITLAVTCGIKGELTEKISNIKGWLYGSGEADLVFSHNSTKKYIAQVVNSFDFEISLRKIAKFVIVFNCQPFLYLVDAFPLEITTPKTNIINIGSVQSEPVIDVYGNGDITLFVNDNEITLKKVEGKITLNTPLQEVYDSKILNKNSNMNGEFPLFKVGDNRISWTGNVNKLSIIPNWRWL